MSICCRELFFEDEPARDRDKDEGRRRSAAESLRCWDS